MSWQDTSLTFMGALVGILLGYLIKPLVSVVFKAKEKEINDLRKIIAILDSKLDNLDKTFAIDLQAKIQQDKKLDTYFAKMDKVLEYVEALKQESYDIKHAARNIEKNQEEYTKLFDKLNTEIMFTARETKNLNVTNKKRQLLLEKQVSRISDKIGIPFDFDPDLFLDVGSQHLKGE